MLTNVSLGLALWWCQLPHWLGLLLGPGWLKHLLLAGFAWLAQHTEVSVVSVVWAWARPCWNLQSPLVPRGPAVAVLSILSLSRTGAL